MSGAEFRWLSRRAIAIITCTLLILMVANIYAGNPPYQVLPSTALSISKSIDKTRMEVSDLATVTLTIHSYVENSFNVTVRDWFPFFFALVTPYSDFYSVEKAPGDQKVQITWKFLIEARRVEIHSYQLEVVSTGSQTLPSAEIDWSNSTASSQEDIEVTALPTSLSSLLAIQLWNFINTASITVVVAVLSSIGGYSLSILRRRREKSKKHTE